MSQNKGNPNHYPAGASGGKGGQFAPKQETSAEIGAGSISYAPTKTREGKDRIYFSDLPKGTQERFERDYTLKHADILSNVDYLYDNFKTSRINSPERDRLRNKMIMDEFNDQNSKGPKKKEKRATILIGLPGSGKSTIANPLQEEMGAFIIDADEFKKRIPEFQKDKKMVSAVHHESVDLADTFRKTLSDEGYNLIIGKVGGDYDSLEYFMDELADKGYSLDVILNDVPFEVALDRTIGRYDRGETDRLVPFWTLKTADKNVFDTFDKALKHRAVTGGKIYNNDVPRGSSPILLKEFKK